MFLLLLLLGEKLLGGDGESLKVGWKLIGAVGGGLNVGGCAGSKGGGGSGGCSGVIVIVLLLLLLLLELKNIGIALFFNALSLFCISMLTVLGYLYLFFRDQALLITIQQLDFEHQKLKFP